MNRSFDRCFISYLAKFTSVESQLRLRACTDSHWKMQAAERCVRFLLVFTS